MQRIEDIRVFRYVVPVKRFFGYLLQTARAAVDAVVNGRKILVGNNFLTLSNTKIAGVAILCDDCLRRGESRRYL